MYFWTASIPFKSFSKACNAYRDDVADMTRIVINCVAIELGIVRKHKIVVLGSYCMVVNSPIKKLCIYFRYSQNRIPKKCPCMVRIIRGPMMPEAFSREPRADVTRLLTNLEEKMSKCPVNGTRAECFPRFIFSIFSHT